MRPERCEWTDETTNEPCPVIANTAVWIWWPTPPMLVGYFCRTHGALAVRQGENLHTHTLGYQCVGAVPGAD